MLYCVQTQIAPYSEPSKSAVCVCAGVANAAFPALVVQSCLTAGEVTLALCARTLLATMALTAVAKVASEGVSAMAAYPRRRGLAMMGECRTRPVQSGGVARNLPAEAGSGPHVRAVASSASPPLGPSN